MNGQHGKQARVLTCALAVVAVTVTLAGAMPSGAPGAGAAGSWGTAIEVPGLGALNTGGDAQVDSVSCASAGNCAAVGYYASHGQQGFVTTEQNGAWGTAIEVPGLGALNTGGTAEVDSVSCASAGNCAAGGYYTNLRSGQQGFVVAERNGAWGQAIKVPGMGTLNTGGDAQVTSVSCAPAGSCAAGGYYFTRHRVQQGFVASERNGLWGQAIKVPGLYGVVTSVSCASAGDCAAGGQGDILGSVATERHGRWGEVIKEPGTGALGKVSASGITSVSCAAAGNCVAGGNYLVYAGAWQGLVVAERNGRWGTAIKVPGLRALNKRGFAEVDSVSCASAGNCVAGGLYSWRGGFVVTERNGRWGTAINVPGLVAPNAGQVAEVVSVSCAPVGSCAAGGYYFVRPGHFHVFVTSEDNGVWSREIQVPGLAALDTGSGQFTRVTYNPTVSCAPSGACAVGGSYIDASGHAQGFVTQAG